ncbi:ABC transporter ATP-binding protein [Ensifer adhaerens]|uniref:ABC transporter ATP-binding protein n=1 Tax=Ensifer adhaerens TaxID=106592 RepID=UPI001CC15C08|nr:ABC transporter ATP-binding protein [Ensifer adhaerens]MBZ7924821.1 ABC transporter ATP-binding protein [Ensifer adhaerens]UAX95958.1 ABC transporter ATP-binding protein [Ensifer adhaerens]UAY04700.1 ABC transporter ATP-binding protein [Ensifer adhaerens]UAY10131.1 ABC transporter ATP-binding protein [Ensifer adhaerens]
MFRNRNFQAAPVALEVKDLTISLSGTGVGAQPVLDRVSLTIRHGETVCLVGESGSGKSVTSLAIMGLLPKNALAVKGGEILLKGRNLLALDAKAMRDLRARKVSMIFQEPMTALNPVLRVGAQVEEVLEMHGDLTPHERRRHVLDMMDQVHLPDVERIYNSFPHQLSGGQRQRIMIAMALILEPQLLIADEPTTALDVTTQKQILSLIAEMQEKHGTAVLFITHDMGVVADIADSVYVMKRGAVVEHAAVGTLLRTPKDEYSRKLLQAVPSLQPRVPRQDAPREHVLSVKSLEKTYPLAGVRKPPTIAATGVNFEIRRGRTLGIVGESGSGKSTVARCIMRLIDPTGGEIRVASKEIAKLSRRQLQPHRRSIQMVFQDPYRSLNPRWTVGESIIEGPLNFGICREDALAHARKLLDLVGLPADAIGRYPHQFSGGQRQRIAIARAVAMRPDVLVADEAVSALDVSVQAQVLNLLDELQAQLGIAILFITHDLRVAAQICDEVVVMQRGRIVEHGAASDVLSSPSHPYTRALIEAAPGRGWDFANFRELAAADVR